MLCSRSMLLPSGRERPLRSACLLPSIPGFSASTHASYPHRCMLDMVASVPLRAAAGSQANVSRAVRAKSCWSTAQQLCSASPQQHWQGRRRWRQQQQQQQHGQLHQQAALQTRGLPACRAAGSGVGTSSMDSNWAEDPPMLSDEEPLSSLDGVLGSSESGQLTEGSPSGGSMRRDRWRVPLPPHLHGKAPRKHWNANALAFLGDSVWELYVRRRFFYPPSAKDSYFGLVVQHVRAETQEKLYLELLASGFLTDTERDVLRWGRNATGVTPKRLADTGLKRETYRAATAIECLCGYLYLSDPQRLHDMMSLLGLGDAPPQASAAVASGDGSSSAGSL